MPIRPISRQRLSGQKKGDRTYKNRRISESADKLQANWLVKSLFELHGLGSTHGDVRIIIQDTEMLSTTLMLLWSHGDDIREIVIVEMDSREFSKIRKAVEDYGLTGCVKVVHDEMVDYMSDPKIQADFIWYDGQKTSITPREIYRIKHVLIGAQCFALTLTNRGRVRGGGLDGGTRIRRVTQLLEPVSGNKSLIHGYKTNMNMFLLGFGRNRSTCRYRVGSVKPSKSSSDSSKVRPFGYKEKHGNLIDVPEKASVLLARGWFEI